MTIEIVDLRMKNGGSFHSYVSLPEGMGIIPMFPTKVGVPRSFLTNPYHL